jgi:hypothetical protein
MASLQYENTDRGTVLYNKDSAPKGRKFSSEQAKELIGKDGWVDSPASFGVVTAKAATLSQDAIEAAVAREKLLFSAAVKNALFEGKWIEFNEVFEQLTAKELEILVVDSGLSDGLDLRRGIEKLRTEVKALIKAHNDGLGE